MGISLRTLALDAIAHAQLAMEVPAANACRAHYHCITYNLKTSAFLNPHACLTNTLMTHLQHVLPAITHVSPAQDRYLQTAQPVEMV
jgi:hypothetical protein